MPTVKKETTVKTELDEMPPEPQRRTPDATFYRRVIGANAGSVVYNMPKNGELSYPPIKRKGNEDSQWDPKLWPKIDTKNKRQINKRECKKEFLLTDNEMADLAYIVEPRWGDKMQYQSHSYLYIEVQRRAWEVYGGPGGLQNAIRKKANKPASPRKGRASAPSTSNRYNPIYTPHRPLMAPILLPYDYSDMSCFCTSCACDYDASD